MSFVFWRATKKTIESLDCFRFFSCGICRTTTKKRQRKNWAETIPIYLSQTAESRCLFGMPPTQRKSLSLRNRCVEKCIMSSNQTTYGVTSAKWRVHKTQNYWKHWNLAFDTLKTNPLKVRFKACFQKST